MATIKTSVTKKSAVKKSAAKKAPTKSAKPAASKTKKTRKISAAERYKMIEVAAYYIAEQNDFNGDTVDFWTAAEAEVDQKIG
ncbi:MAG: DUF2934 domain-containing protein [Methylophilaceae bacterium]